MIGISEVDEMDDEDDKVYLFEVFGEWMEDVWRWCKDIDFFVLEEYDFRNDMINFNFDI